VPMRRVDPVPPAVGDGVPAAGDRRGAGCVVDRVRLVWTISDGPRCNTSYPLPVVVAGVSLTGCTMIEVVDAAAAGRALAERMLRCPDCSPPLRPWGHASARTVRDLDGGAVTARPDRARCTGCAATHVLLDAALLPRRGHTARVVGHALLRAAQGESRREIAERMDAPRDTVRGWIRRARRSAHQLWTLGVAAVVALDQDAMPTRERSDPLAAALDALAAAAFAMRRRFGPVFDEPWSTITVLTRGRLLAPSPTG
jgi:transposase-like protein